MRSLQPMSTAPRDGTYVLIFTSRDCHLAAFDNVDGEKMWVYTDLSFATWEQDEWNPPEEELIGWCEAPLYTANHVMLVIHNLKRSLTKTILRKIKIGEISLEDEDTEQLALERAVQCAVLADLTCPKKYKAAQIIPTIDEFMAMVAASSDSTRNIKSRIQKLLEQIPNGVEGLLQKSERDLFSMNNIGRETVSTIVCTLAKFDLRIAKIG